MVPGKHCSRVCLFRVLPAAAEKENKGQCTGAGSRRGDLGRQTGLHTLTESPRTFLGTARMSTPAHEAEPTHLNAGPYTS